MNDVPHPPHNRREFFRKLARYPAVIALVAVGGALEMRGIKLAGQGKCTRGAFCGGCLELPNCPLPQALESKGTNLLSR